MAKLDASTYTSKSFSQLGGIKTGTLLNRFLSLLKALVHSSVHTQDSSI
jgi:hypothetical protein